MLNRGTLCFALALASGVWVHAAPAPGRRQIAGKDIVLARYAKAFIGNGNVKVEVAPYKSGGQDGAIVVIHGVEGDWDGQAIVHRVKPATYEGTDYVTSYEGRDWRTLEIRQSGGKSDVVLRVPGVKDDIPLVASDGAAQLTSPEAIYQTYAEQLKAAPATQGPSTAQLNGKHHAEIQSDLDAKAKEANAACGASTTAAIDWKSFDAIDPGIHSIAGYCSAPLNALRSLCVDAPGKAAVKKEIQKIVCRFGGPGKRAIGLAGGTVDFAVDWDASNNDDYAEQYLEGKL